jgi:hypothetical protein
LESGPRAKQMAMAFINGKMEIDMKENGNFVLNMAKAQICLQTETFTQDSIPKENHMVSGSTSGKILQFMSGNSEAV